jgi:hypothetical protein
MKQTACGSKKEKSLSILTMEKDLKKYGFD